ncbi:MAG: helix-turn-helix domain-containing protein [Solirubrobacteraceae bacterium]
MRFNVDRPAVNLSEPLLTASQAAAMLSVRTSWVYDAARSGVLPCVHIGKHIRFLRAEIERFVAEQRAGR